MPPGPAVIAMPAPDLVVKVGEPARSLTRILGLGMLSAGWQAHKLNAPGKFLCSSPEHDT
jgi:hypothetical protein